MFEAAILVLFPCLVAYAGVSDLFTMKIPNRVSLLLIGGFAIIAPFAGIGPVEIGWHLLAAGLALAACLVFFGFGWMGGGDAKLVTAVALWFGMSQDLLMFLVLAGIYGAGLTLLIVSFRGIVLLPGIAGRTQWLLRLHDHTRGIPYGVTLSIAALQVYPQSAWFRLLA
ncbi:prepilin peptidase [Stappia sp. TSB10P1A]|uniref:A24 family peptidase n=1 Tax=Stappia sp. TSB10P1A TaxID=2003585 RepID=UPI001643A364|nr:prepilin peptidase [Stappia sp. TSB10P1A]